MDHVIITIARQYGSGGRTIGQMLAKKRGIHCYNRDILRMASDDSGINMELFGAADERVKKNFFQKIFKNQAIYSGKLYSPESDGFVSDDNLFNYQAKIMKELANTESCVIIGRCADYVLKDYSNVIRVFIHASEEYCFERAMENNSMSPKEMKKFIHKTDQYRGDFYKHYTGNEWEDARNYDLCLDSGKLGFEKCVEMIEAYEKIRFAK